MRTRATYSDGPTKYMHAPIRQSRIRTQSHGTHSRTCIHQIGIQLAYEMELPLSQWSSHQYISFSHSCVFVCFGCPDGAPERSPNGRKNVRINGQITISHRKIIYRYEKGQHDEREGDGRCSMVFTMRFIYIGNINFLLKTERKKKLK